jgi:putative nucleotidyltransferase with HDIG domain
MSTIPSAAELTRNLPNLSSLPAVIEELENALDRGDASMDDLGEIVKKDTDLTARLLRLANSSFYGFPKGVDTVGEALSLIGIEQMKQLLSGSSVIEYFQSIPSSSVNMRSFWEHSIATGIAAKVIAVQRRAPNPELFFVSGLIHDIGRLVFYLRIPEQAAELLQAHHAEPSVPLYQREVECFGYDHGRVGGELLKRWDFPNSLVEAVTHHHKPPLADLHFSEASVIHLADFVSTPWVSAIAENGSFPHSIPRLGTASTCQAPPCAPPLGRRPNNTPTPSPCSCPTDLNTMPDTQTGKEQTMIGHGLRGLDSTPELSRHFLQVLASLEKFQKEIHDTKSRDEALSKLQQYVQSWDIFEITAFYLVDQDLQFTLYSPSSPDLAPALDAFISQQIRSGKFAWALQQNRELLVDVTTGLPGNQAILHGMSTRHTTLGIFVGVMKQEASFIRSSYFKILSILIDAVVYSHENHNLLEELTQYNQQLERIVDSRTKELQHSNQHLLQSNTELKKLNEKKSEFLGIVAHDLKNPLSGIIGLAELIRDNLKTCNLEQLPNLASSQEMLTYIHSSASQMVSTLNELMNSEVIESGHLKLDCVPLDLSELAKQVVTINQTQALAKNIRIHFESTNDVWILADAIRIHEAIDNLLSNAIKYSPFDREVWVKVRPEKRFSSGSCAVLSVTDQGPGLSDDDKRKLFGRFQKLSAQPTGGESSTGLGLSIVRNLVQLHRGEVKVQSAIGKGSTFSIELPLHSQGHNQST